MSATGTAVAIKQAEVSAYDDCAPIYARHWGRCTERVASGLVDLLDPPAGATCIDIAGGTGAGGLQLAARVGSTGTVLITDISPGMIRQARRLADSRRLDNVQTAVMDAEALDVPSDHFSVAISTFGLMFMPDIERATAEIARVLRPGGTLAVAVWSTIDRVPFIGLQLDAVRTVVEGPLRLGFLPDRFGEEGELEQALAAAGFEDLRLESRTFSAEFASVEDYIEATFEGVPIKAMLDSVAPDAHARAASWLRDRCEARADGSLCFANDVRFVIATLPQGVRS